MRQLIPVLAATAGVAVAVCAFGGPSSQHPGHHGTFQSVRAISGGLVFDGPTLPDTCDGWTDVRLLSPVRDGVLRVSIDVHEGHVHAACSPLGRNERSVAVSPLPAVVVVEPAGELHLVELAGPSR